MAERVRFELTVPVKARQFSRVTPCTAVPRPCHANASVCPSNIRGFRDRPALQKPAKVPVLGPVWYRAWYSPLPRLPLLARAARGRQSPQAATSARPRPLRLPADRYGAQGDPVLGCRGHRYPARWGCPPALGAPMPLRGQPQRPYACHRSPCQQQHTCKVAHRID